MTTGSIRSARRRCRNSIVDGSAARRRCSRARRASSGGSTTDDGLKDWSREALPGWSHDSTIPAVPLLLNARMDAQELQVPIHQLEESIVELAGRNGLAGDLDQESSLDDSGMRPSRSRSRRLAELELFLSE